MFGGIGKRRGFIRIAVSPRERALSVGILMLIAGIGTAIYTKSRRYDPALFGLEQAAMSAAQPAQAQPQDLAYEADEGAVPGDEEDGEWTPAGDSAAPPDQAALLSGLVPEGWRPLGDIEYFTPATLYEKIDGRAEQYEAYDVVGLTCMSLQNSADEGRFIDVFVYDMGQPLRAFGIYSVERSPDQPAIDLGREGYRVEASTFFWKGPYYVLIMASDTGAQSRQAVQEIARTLLGRLRDSGEPIWGLTALPETDRIPGTVRYYMRDALSLSFMENTCTARYQKGDAVVTVFLSKQPSPEVAAEALTKYLAYMEKYGRVVNTREAEGASLTTGDMGGIFDVIFRKGPLLAGVTMAADRTLAERTASDLLSGLSGDR